MKWILPFLPSAGELPTCIVLLLSLSCAVPSASLAQPQEKTAPEFTGQTEGNFVIKDFQFRDGGVALPELRLHYMTLGSPHRNASGEVNNAILLLHSTGGDTTEFLDPEFSDPLFRTGEPFDLAKFYIIIPDAIGHGKSSKPSDRLRAHFPHYDYEDMVNAQYRLVTQKLGVTHLRLVMGLSMGGMHTWLWGERYPDMMDALMPISALPVEIAGRNRLWRRMVIDAIRTDPDWKNGDYEQPPHGYAWIVPLIAMMVSSPVRLYEKYPTRASADTFYDHLIQVGATRDANDRLYQYDASRNYNPTPDLDKIKAKLLLIVFADDQINSPQFGALDHQMPRVSNGRFVIVPAGNQSNGEGNNTDAKLWWSHLEDLLQSSTAVSAASRQDMSGSKTAESVAAEAELRAVMDERRKASLEGNTDKIATSLANEYLQTDITGYVQDKTAWLNEYFKPLAELIKAGKFHWEVFEAKDVQIRVYGDSAIAIGTLEAEGSGARYAPTQHTWVADPNANFSGTLRFTHVYIKRNGKWLLAALHNAVPLPPSNK